MNKINKLYRQKLLIVAAIALLGFRCSPEQPDNGDYGSQYKIYPNNTDDGAVTTIEDSIPFSDTVNVQAGTGSTVPVFVDAEVANGSLGVDAACAAFSSEATQREVQVPTEVEVEVVGPEPVALFLMLDQSLSMSETSGLSSSTKWYSAVSAINQFVADSPEDSLDMALQYFPLIHGDCATGFGYNIPEVPIGRLPDNTQAITSSLAIHMPGMGITPYTPIEGALRGVTGFCSQFMQTNPDGEECVAVLVTDGLPTMCSEDSNVLIGIAASAYANSRVRTYTIGMAGADFALLDQIARAGNGDCTPDPFDTSWACNVSNGTTTFLDALENIRGLIVKLETRTEMKTIIETKQLDCEWAIPESPSDQTFDKDLVNVQFSLTGQSQDTFIFGRVDSAEACGGSEDSWYYDNLDNPTTIVACPRTCDNVKATSTGKITILFGCETVLTVH